MKRLFLFICLASIVCCAGIKLPDRKGPQDFDRETIKYFKSMGNGGTITAFLGDSSLRGNLMQASYWMTTEEIFKGKYFIGNYNHEPEEVTLFCLLDYRQVEFMFNNRTGLSHKIRLKKDEEMEVPIKIGRLPKGAHDLLIVAAKVSKSDPMLSYLQTHRANVFVNSAEFPRITLADEASSKMIKTDNRVFKIQFEEGLKASSGKLRVKLNNVLEEDVTSLVLLFDNFKQIDHVPLFFKLSRQQEVDVSAAAVDVKNLCFAVKINNPFTLMEPEPNTFAGEDRSVEMSNIIFDKP